MKNKLDLKRSLA